MGTFGGHALPGSFFIMFSGWWTLNILNRYYSAVFQRKKPYISTMTFPCPCLCGKLHEWEIEGFVKILFTLVGFTLEIITAMPHGKFIYMGNGQHATMFFFFGLSGVIDILVHNRVILPRGIEYICMILSFATEGILFKFHLYGRDDLDVLIHTLLVYVIFATVLALIAEMCWRRHALIALTRSYLVLLQGTWFWQIAFILYSPLPHPRKWDPDNNNHLLMAAMFFAWHMGINFIIMLAVAVSVGTYHKRRGSHFQQDDEDLGMNLIKQDRNGRAILKMADSDSEVEFERCPS